MHMDRLGDRFELTRDGKKLLYRQGALTGASPEEAFFVKCDRETMTQDDIDSALDAWIVSEALSALSREHRDVIVELYYRGRSVAEAAQELRIPAGTVKSRTYYALRALRLTLEERGLTP